MQSPGKGRARLNSQERLVDSVSTTKECHQALGWMNSQSMVTITQTVVTFSAHCSLLLNPDTKPLLSLPSVHVFPQCPCLVVWFQLELAKLSSSSAPFKKNINGLTYLAPLPEGTPQSSFGQEGQGVKQLRDPPSLLPKASCWAQQG